MVYDFHLISIYIRCMYVVRIRKISIWQNLCKIALNYMALRIRRLVCPHKMPPAPTIRSTEGCGFVDRIYFISRIIIGRIATFAQIKQQPWIEFHLFNSVTMRSPPKTVYESRRQLSRKWKRLQNLLLKYIESWN